MTVELDTFDLLSFDVQQCPFPYYARMRAEQPVFHDPRTGMWLITRYEDVLEAVRQPEVFSSRFGGPSSRPDRELADRLREIQATGYESKATLLTADPPEHNRYRALVSKAFSPRAVAALRPSTQDIADDLIDAFIGDGSVELVRQFAVGLPLTVIADALGVPRSDLADFKRWSDDSVAAIGADLSPERRLEAARGIIEYQHYFASVITARRETLANGGQLPADLLTGLITARLDDPGGEAPGGGLDLPEMLSILQQLLVAGNETTTKLVTETMLLLCRHPPALDALRADPGLVVDVVEEGLRMATPTQAMFRVVTRDTAVGGVDIPAGSTALLVYASANRDETRFPDPDRFDVSRENAKQHLAFGNGIHFCIGASLARAEAQVGVATLVSRLHGLRLADANTFEIEPSFVLRGLRELRLDFEPGTPRGGPGA